MVKTKILVKVSNGINDIFSAIAFNIDKLHKHNLDASNIDITHYKYKNLDKYIRFEKINYLKTVTDIFQYSEIYKIGCGAYTNINFSTPLHLSNYIFLTEHISAQIKNIKPNIGLHFRFMSQERNQTELMKKDVDRYIQNFLKVYDPKESYFACSSSPLLNDFFKDFKNVIYFPKNYIASLHRELHIEDVFLDLAILSKCKSIYYNEGQFVHSAQVFSREHIKFIQF